MPRFVIEYLTLFLSLLLISGCNEIFDKDTPNSNEVYETKTNIKVYFCPADNCEKVLQTYVNYAKSSVHCAFFDLDPGDLVTALAKKSHDSDVRVVIDDQNYDGQIKGVGIKTAKSKQYMHNKFCIIDKGIVLTGSTNPTDNGLNSNNNNLIILSSKYLAENYEDEFNELWNGVYASGDNVKYNRISTNVGSIENYFCPEDCATGNFAVNNIIRLIKKSEKSVKVAIFSFTDENLADELVKSDIKGINVTILVERTQRNVQNSQYARLRDFGLDIRVDGNKQNMHHKFIVIDDNIVITGSPNFSWSGFNRNDENMLIIQDKSLASEYRNEFDRLFDDGEDV